jgi:casein kinase II subunit beta
MPPSSRFSTVDGSFFGTTFPHLLFQSFKELLPSHSASKQQTAQRAATDALSPAGATDDSRTADIADHPVKGHTTPATSALRVYVPKIYGFKVSERARSGPRMTWLRLKPKDDRELDRVDFGGKWKAFDAGAESTDDDEPAAPVKGKAKKPAPLKLRGEESDSFMDE